MYEVDLLLPPALERVECEKSFFCFCHVEKLICNCPPLSAAQLNNRASRNDLLCVIIRESLSVSQDDLLHVIIRGSLGVSQDDLLYVIIRGSLSVSRSGRRDHSLFLLSIIIVTGPSLVKLTFMSAPNIPVAISFPVNTSSCSLKKL